MRTHRQSIFAAALVFSVVAGLCGKAASGEEARPLLEAGRLVEAEAAARKELDAAAQDPGVRSRPWADAADLLVDCLLREEKSHDPMVRSVAEQAVQVREALDGPQDIALAGSLLRLGKLLHRQGQTQAARAALERALAITEPTGTQPPPGGSSPPAGRRTEALVLAALAMVRSEAAETKEALTLLDRARAIVDGTADIGADAVTGVLIQSASVRRRMGETMRADSLLARALSVAEQSSGPDSLTVASVLAARADVWKEARDQARAQALVERAIAIRERAVGRDHVLLARPLSTLGFALKEQGRLDAAERAFRRALDILQREPAADRGDLAAVLDSYGDLQIGRGEYEEGTANLQRGLDIAREVYGPTHPNISSSLNNLAVAAYSVGDYEQARRYFASVAEMDAATLGPDHPYLADSMNNLAGIQVLLGEDREAVTLFRRCIRLAEHAYGPTHPSVGAYLVNLGTALRELGEVDSSLATFQRALPLLEADSTEASPIVLASALSEFAQLQAKRGDLKAARSAAERSLALREQSLGHEHPDVAQSLHQLGAVLAQSGDLKAARERLQQSVELRERTLGPAHPDLGCALQELARVELRQGDRAAACTAACRAESIGREHLRLLARGLSEPQALAYARVRPRGCEIALGAAAAAQDVALVRAAWNELIRSRALVLDEMAARGALAATSADPRLRDDTEAMRKARARLARLALRGPTGTLPEFEAQMEQARADKERIERALADRVHALQQQSGDDAAGFDEIAAVLPAGMAVVAYARCIDEQQQPRACALILGADSPHPKIQLLGPWSEIEARVGRWRRAVEEGAVPAGPLRQNAERSCRAAGEALRAAVWDPIAPELEGATRVFVIPEGPLQWVNLSALPVAGDRYLIESGPVIHVLSTERDLLPPSTSTIAAAAATPERRASGLLAIGGPDFDAAPGAPEVRTQQVVKMGEDFAPPAETRGTRSSCDELSRLRFAPLSRAQQEARDVAGIFAKGSGSTTAVLAGAQATEARLKREAAGRQVLHLATHGFFLGAGCTPKPAPGVDALAAPIATASAPWVLSENPLLLSGLALASANRRTEAPVNAEDGVLTAEEIAALDLTRTTWVVLSACDTGLGVEAAEEGVLGMRRALRVAGARSLILSLWRVDDAATRRFMEQLYRERFERHADTAAAVHAASLAALQQARTAGSGHPFQWAAFLAVGDWR